VLGGKIHALARGRAFVSEDDIRAVAFPSLRHRLLLGFEGEVERIDPDALISELVSAL
jgi:MoxR-like ATPase